MATNFGAHPLSLAVQAHGMRAWPGFDVSTNKNLLVARGPLRPSSVSKTYAVRVEYSLTECPKGFIESPKLVRRAAAPDSPIPHTYDSNLSGQERPCTFFPSTDWNRTMKLSNTVIPWLMAWLLDYELWHATGTWFGGGVSHAPSGSDDANLNERGC